GEDREEAGAARALDLEVDLVALEGVDQGLLVVGQVPRRVRVPTRLLDLYLVGLLLEGDGLDGIRPVEDLVAELRVRGRRLLRARADQALGEDRQHDHDQYGKGSASEEPPHVSLSLRNSACLKGIRRVRNARISV